MRFKHLRCLLRGSLTVRQRLIINVVLNRGNARYLFKTVLSVRSRAHQTSGTTAYDRYPGIFLAAKRLLLTPKPRVLSFGCSTVKRL